jgi:hypothetical protein
MKVQTKKLKIRRSYNRSSFAAQRITGLNFLGEILRKVNAGVYDAIFDVNLIKKVLDSSILFLLRFALDENVAAVVAASVNALHGLVCCELDEVS